MADRQTRADAKGVQQTARVKLLTAARLRVWGARTVRSLLDQGLTAGASFVANPLLARWLAPRLCGAFALAFAGFLLVTGFHNVIFLEPMTVYGASRYREEVGKYFADPFSLQPPVFSVWIFHVSEDMPEARTRVLVLHCDDYRAQQSTGFHLSHYDLIEDYRLDDPSLRYRSLVRLLGLQGRMIAKRLRCNTMVFRQEPRV